jgi:hypothetical protein
MRKGHGQNHALEQCSAIFVIYLTMLSHPYSFHSASRLRRNLKIKAPEIHHS